MRNKRGRRICFRNYYLEDWKRVRDRSTRRINHDLSLVAAPRRVWCARARGLGHPWVQVRVPTAAAAVARAAAATSAAKATSPQSSSRTPSSARRKTKPEPLAGTRRVRGAEAAGRTAGEAGGGAGAAAGGAAAAAWITTRSSP